jgi:tetratricopeptide (TPR) repeat protein
MKPATGDVLDNRYRLQEELGRGGMGLVFAAFDMSLTKRVAIKFILSDDPAGVEVSRFQREAVGLASLRGHPNILTIYHSEEHSKPPYLITELLEGHTLAAKLAQDPPAVAASVRIAIQIAKGLAGVHKRQLIHRDLKPGNIFIVEDGQVKLIDFGAVKLSAGISVSIDAPARSREGLTGKGRVLGTPGYMGPEQIRGGELDCRADLFGFGAVLYEMLAGRRAFVAGSEGDENDAILHGEPPPLPKSVPAPLRQIVERCLQKDPAQRFQSAAELQKELERVRESLPKVEGKPAKTGGRPARWIAAAAFVLLLAASLGYRAAWVPPGTDPIGPAASTPVVPVLQLKPGPWIAIGAVKSDAASAGAASIVEKGLARGLSTIADLEVQRPGETPPRSGPPLWLLKSQLSQEGKILRLSMQFETAGGQRVGKAVEAEGIVKTMLESVTGLGLAMRAELMPLWNDARRRERAHTLASNPDAEAKLASYYDLPGALGSQHLAAGRRLLEEALAADPDYLPALVEKARVAVAASVTSDEPLADLHEASEAADKALGIAPGDPEALLEKCRAEWGETFRAPTDERIKRAISSCSDATRSARQSATAFYGLAQMYDQDCEDAKLIDALKSAIERAQRYDPPRENMTNLFRVSVALQRGQWDEADVASTALLHAEGETERLRSLMQGSLDGFVPLQQVHFFRAATLVRLKRYAEAEKEFEAELGHDSKEFGGVPEKIEAACLRGLSSLAARRGQPLSPRRVARLKELEKRLRALDASTEVAPLAGFYWFADPEAGAAWLAMQPPPTDCATALQHATIYRDAGHFEAAARALDVCHPTEQWVKRCVRGIQSQIGLPK